MRSILTLPAPSRFTEVAFITLLAFHYETHAYPHAYPLTPAMMLLGPGYCVMHAMHEPGEYLALSFCLPV